MADQTGETPFPGISEKAREFIEQRMPDPSIPLSQTNQTPCCASCGEDLGEEQIWKKLGDGETYLVCAKCAPLADKVTPK